MASTKSNVRKLKSQPKPQLTHIEVQRIAEKLAVALEHNAENIGLLLLLFDHIETVGEHNLDVWSSIFTIKTHLFVGTNAQTDAQEQFQAAAYANRGKLLRWPHEQGAK